MMIIALSYSLYRPSGRNKIIAIKIFDKLNAYASPFIILIVSITVGMLHY